jgi:hypothetical protein
VLGPPSLGQFLHFHNFLDVNLLQLDNRETGEKKKVRLLNCNSRAVSFEMRGVFDKDIRVSKVGALQIGDEGNVTVLALTIGLSIINVEDLLNVQLQEVIDVGMELDLSVLNEVYLFSVVFLLVKDVAN